MLFRVEMPLGLQIFENNLRKCAGDNQIMFIGSILDLLTLSTPSKKIFQLCTL